MQFFFQNCHAADEKFSRTAIMSPCYVMHPSLMKPVIKKRTKMRVSRCVSRCQRRGHDGSSRPSLHWPLAIVVLFSRVSKRILEESGVPEWAGIKEIRHWGSSSHCGAEMEKRDSLKASQCTRMRGMSRLSYFKEKRMCQKKLRIFFPRQDAPVHDFNTLFNEFNSNVDHFLESRPEYFCDEAFLVLQ